MKIKILGGIMDIQDIAIRIGFTLLSGFLMVYFIIMGWILL